MEMKKNMSYFMEAKQSNVDVLEWLEIKRGENKGGKKEKRVKNKTEKK